MASAEKKLSKAVIIRQLQQVCDEKQAEYNALLLENQTLRTREEVLLQQVTQQGDNLHFVALAAAQVEAADMPDIAKTLVQDLEVYELLGMLGRSSSSSPNEPEPFTTQRLRAAVTPERVAAMRSATVNEVCTNLKQLTMRMYMLLAAGQHKQEFFSDSIEAVVNEYGEYGLLLHVAADWVSLQIGTMNLETQQVQEPPPGYWENVVDHLELQEHQIETLAMGFNSYQQKSKPIISALHSTVSKIRAVLGADETTGDTSMSGEGGASCVPAAAAVGAAGSGTGQDFVHLLQSAGEQDGSGSGNGFACSMPSQSEQALQQQQCGLCSHLSNSSACTCGTGACSNGNGQVDNRMVAAMSKPWQQFGLSHGCLTAETAEDLEQDMRVLMQNVMKLREMHRTVTWLFLNTLNARQHALFITNSWPWWSRPLTMCQYIAEQHERLHKPTQRQQHSGNSKRSSDGAPPSQGTFGAAAAAVADGVWQMTLGSTGMRPGSNSSMGRTTAASHGSRGKHAAVHGSGLS